MKFHHVGIASRNIQEDIEHISKIHRIVKQTPVIFDPEQNAELCLLTTDDGLNLELISGKAVETILKRKVSYYHLCYEVDNIDLTIQQLIDSGASLVSEPRPAILFNNRPVAFLYVSYGLIELLSVS